MSCFQIDPEKNKTLKTINDFSEEEQKKIIFFLRIKA